VAPEPLLEPLESEGDTPAPEELEFEEVEFEVVDEAPAEPSDAAMIPTSAVPIATLTPAARIRPCMLKLRRAMEGLSRCQIRVG
jgi:hypothetical protein